MPYEDSVLSAPRATDEEVHGARVFERIRRDIVDGRRCAPCDNSWVAVDRVVFTGRTGLLFRRYHDCWTESELIRDLVDRGLAAVGLEVLHMARPTGLHRDVITGDVPGVRLRALVDTVSLAGIVLPSPVVWHIVDRSTALRSAWRALGVTPLDTFVGFDGSLHLFPTLPACMMAERPSWVGDERFDVLLVDESPGRLAQLLGAWPQPCFELRDESDPAVTARVDALLAGTRSHEDAADLLATLVQCHFPHTHARHRRVYAGLGRDLEGDGRAREARILAHCGPVVRPLDERGRPEELERTQPIVIAGADSERVAKGPWYRRSLRRWWPWR